MVNLLAYNWKLVLMNVLFKKVNDLNKTAINNHCRIEYLQSFRCVCCGCYVPEGARVCSNCISNNSKGFFCSREFLNEVTNNSADHIVEQKNALTEMGPDLKK